MIQNRLPLKALTLLLTTFLSNSPAIDTVKTQEHFTWKTTTELLDKKYALANTWVPYMVIQSDQQMCPIKAIMFKIFVSSPEIADAYQIRCHNPTYHTNSPKLSVNLWLRDVRDYDKFLNSLSKITFSSTYLTNERYPLSIALSFSDRDKIPSIIKKIGKLSNFNYSNMDELTKASQYPT